MPSILRDGAPHLLWIKVGDGNKKHVIPAKAGTPLTGQFIVPDSTHPDLIGVSIATSLDPPVKPGDVDEGDLIPGAIERIAKSDREHR